MDESELDRIRSARLSEMKGSSGMQSGPSLQGGTDHSKEAEQQAQQEQQRSNMLFQILNNDARTRCKIYAYIYSYIIVFSTLISIHLVSKSNCYPKGIKSESC